MLQSIGCDNKAVLSAACDRNDGVINIPVDLEADAKNEASGHIV